MCDIDLQQINNTQYPEDVIRAVRYGYQYRLEAEKYADDGILMNDHLEDASGALLWLGKLVIDGIAFEAIKRYAKSLWDKLMSMKVSIPDDVNKVLLEEDELRKFVVFVKEFDDKELTTTSKQTKYIREEIMADYVGKAAGDMWKKEHRLPTHEEWVQVYRDANSFADKLLDA
jgi:hypothetical protein